tara:strand:+ start:544 stop:735 length:192 start_codon:yes stop_codon:yes gene_type:complete
MLTAATAIPIREIHQKLSIRTETPMTIVPVAAQLEGSIDRLVIHFKIVFMLVFLLLLEIYNEK